MVERINEFQRNDQWAGGNNMFEIREKVKKFSNGGASDPTDCYYYIGVINYAIQKSMVEAGKKIGQLNEHHKYQTWELGNNKKEANLVNVCIIRE